MENLDKVIKRVIGISEDAIDTTPMDKGECKKVAQEWLAVQKLPHEDEIDSALDTLLEIRGEYSSRVRNPIYGEERKLAKDLVKYVLLKQIEI